MSAPAVLAAPADGPRSGGWRVSIEDLPEEPGGSKGSPWALGAAAAASGLIVAAAIAYLKRQ